MSTTVPNHLSAYRNATVMTANAEKSRTKSSLVTTSALTSQEALEDMRANEVFVGIVGPAGSGSGTAAEKLKSYLEREGFKVELIIASSLIKSAAKRFGFKVPDEDSRKTLNDVVMLQDRGDELREGRLYKLREDHTAIARMALEEVARRRAKNQNLEYIGKPILPDGEHRAYIIYSLRHPSEASLLREAYQDAFTLLGIFCAPLEREHRIIRKYFEKKKWNEGGVKEKVKSFMDRDENALEKYGQHVSDAFHEADFFVDNSKYVDDLADTEMNNELRRFVGIITQKNIIRPRTAETAMHHAHSAKMRSACLSRQVGAALVDAYGNIVATGTNDVPRAGGGLYGEGFAVGKAKDDMANDEEEESNFDKRCAFFGTPFCRNNDEQNKIIEELISILPLDNIKLEKRELMARIRSTRIGGLIEFSRAVHAEMDAILSAATAGISPRGCRLFVTTFPCHYCARHIVASGIYEVQFIEPYPKSKAIDLHSDSITTNHDGWLPPSHNGDKVLFRPYVGVAPRFYRKAFLKDRSYKDDQTGKFAMGNPKWGRPTEIYKESYPSLEVNLALRFDDD